MGNAQSPPPFRPPAGCVPRPRSVIHQPSSEVFALFDKLCLLSEGRVVYFGEPHRLFNCGALPKAARLALLRAPPPADPPPSLPCTPGAANRAIDFFAEAGLAVPSNRNPGAALLCCAGKGPLLLPGCRAAGPLVLSARVALHGAAIPSHPLSQLTTSSTASTQTLLVRLAAQLTDLCCRQLIHGSVQHVLRRLHTSLPAFPLLALNHVRCLQRAAQQRRLWQALAECGARGTASIC